MNFNISMTASLARLLDCKIAYCIRFFVEKRKF